MSITTKIENIIAIRQQRVVGLKKKLDFLKNLQSAVEQILVLKSEVNNTLQTGKGKFKLVLDKNAGLSERILNLPVDLLLQSIKKQTQEVEFLVRRFSRKSIQISVVGKSKQGKSRLLQSISGLESEVIPDSNASDCTGTKSVISNNEGSLYAQVIFYSEKEMIEQVQKYLDVLQSGKILGSVSDIKGLNIDTINAETASDESKKFHLQKYVNHFDEYSGNLGKNIKTTEKREIRKYVAQQDTNGSPIYNFLAVKEVQIYTPFNYKDAGKIVLVDTIGLGDTSLGIREKMIETLTYDSDAAIIVRRPDAMGDGLHEEDDVLVDLIQSKMKDRAIDKWLFYVLNLVNLPNNTNEQNATAMKNALQRKQQGGKINTALIEMVDCSKSEDVENKLVVPMLDILSNNLSEIDNDFMKRADKTGHELYFAFFSFLKDLQNVLVKDLRTDGNLNVKLHELFDEFYSDNLLGSLKAMCLEMERNRNNSCSVLDKEFKRITTFNPDTKIPSIADIEQALRRGGVKGQPSYVYSEFVANLRTNLTEEFIKIDESLTSIVDEFKKNIVELLANKPRLSLIYPIDDSKHPKEWLLDFSNDALNGLEQLQFAFIFLYNFELSVRGFLMHKIRKHTDILDPDIPAQIPQLGSQAEQAIRAELRNRLTLLRDSLKKELRNFTQDPNETFFAVIKEFYDRLAYAPEAEKQWRRLYFDNYATVWKSEIQADADLQIAFDEWQKYIEDIRKYNNKNQFILIN
jgi:energy-coupling factor transporter ATP-binding protein EcfA2